MKKQPPPQWLPLLKYLVEHFLKTEVDLDNPETLLTYKQVHSHFDLRDPDRKKDETLGTVVDKELDMDGLSKWLIDNKLPAITGIIIAQDTSMPGNGFFELYKEQIKEFDLERKKQDENYQASNLIWLKEEIQKACSKPVLEKLQKKIKEIEEAS